MEKDERSYDVAIIGGGPGGYTAALYCARAGLSAVVLEKLSPGGQMATTSQVDNYPGFENGIDGFELGERMQQGAERFGVTTVFGEVRQANLTAQPKLLHTSEGDYEAKTVILAAGASPKELGVPGEASLRGRGVAYCATCDGMFFKGKTVAVVGGGNSAVADALFLSKICEKVYLIHRRDELRASKVYMDSLQKVSNIEFVWNSRVKKFLYEKNLTGIEVEETGGRTKQITCDGVFVAVGRIPNTQLGEGQLELDERGYIVADETTRTSVPGVFAVGDLRTKPLRQIITAASDGAVASLFAEEYIASLS